MAAPAASGRLTVTNGRYENFATGAVLKDLRLDIVGDRDRLTIREFAARDSAEGSLAAQGGVTLGNIVPGATGGPVANISVTLKDFRIIGRDLAVAAASGTVAVTGPLASPHVMARLTTDQGQVNLPSSLPPDVTRIDVVEINGRAGAAAARRKADGEKTAPALPATLDIQIAVPGRIFVRGRGLDSEWRGQLAITGTSDAPQITGSLEAIRGTFDVLGKTFRVTHGEIGFHGGATIDPVLDITAEVAAADITAQVMLKGPVSAPKLTMTSIPAVPQDEILSRVLFGRALGQITPAEGLQVAATAASLAGGGFDVLDKLRGTSRARSARVRLGPRSGRRGGDEQLEGGGLRRRHHRRQVYRQRRLCRRVAGADGGIEQGRGRGRGAAAGDRAGRCQPERQHRHRAQLQIRLLTA